MRQDGKIDDLELPGSDIERTKTFYGAAFGWNFVSYAPRYVAFDEGLEGRFDADDLEVMRVRVEAASGTIVRPLFAFPGGLRVTDPAGTELVPGSER